MPLANAPDLELFRTGDGSFTLRSEKHKEGYHSRHGAVQESTHVFIHMGLMHVLDRIDDRPVDILEVGLGTGLNMLLTWIRCLEGKCRVNYTALEPYPLSRNVIEKLAYPDDLGWPGLGGSFLDLMTAPPVDRRSMEGGMEFRSVHGSVQELDLTEEFDLVYFDAFAPHVQPEMWTSAIFDRIYGAMRRGAVLVTYCAKGDVRRTLEATGFTIERLPGPPGKREMLRATK